MLDYKEFSRQKFFDKGNYRKLYSHVESELILGKPEYHKMAIVIPTYKREDLLDEALKSCVNQSYDDYNIIISDNEPIANNKTQQLIESYDNPRIVYYRNKENIGPLGNFNRCIELADSEYCVFLCTDDLLTDDFLEKSVEILDKTGKAAMMLPQKDVVYPGVTKKMMGYSHYLRFLKKLLKKDVYMKLTPKDFMLYYPPGGPSGIIYHRQIFMDSPGFNPDWHPTGDNILHIYLTHHYNVYLTSVESGQYRFLDNISMESNMSTIFILQNYLFKKVYIEKYRGYEWVKPYWKGYTFYRLIRDRRHVFDAKKIRQVMGQTKFIHFIFNRMIWIYHMMLVPFRVK